MTIGPIGASGVYGYSYNDYASQVNSRSINEVSSTEQSTQVYQGNTDSSEVRQTDTFRPNNGEMADFATVNFIRNSFPEPLPDNRVQNYTIDDFMEGASVNNQQQVTPPQQPITQVEVRQVEERVSESATVNTSENIAERESGNQLTPAQQRGVETYVRTQNYGDAIAVSANATQFVA